MMPAVKSPQGSGDPIFSLYDRQDRIFDRLNKKINRQNQRITALKMWGRS